MTNPRLRNALVYASVGFIILIVFISLSTTGQSAEEIAFTDVVSYVKRGEVAQIEVTGDDLLVALDNGEQFVSSKSPESTAQEQFLQFGVTTAQIERINWDFQQPSNLPNIGFSLITAFLPILLIGALILFMFRQAQGNNNQAMSFGKSRARMFVGDRPTVTFDDVAGADESKEELAEVVEFLKEPQKFMQLGARIPKGVLLIGSPGTGKTLLGKAVAGEAGVPFFSISGSEFVEMFVGVGASRVRDLFEQAKRHSPCIVFIDEIDAVGRHRGAGLGGSHDEREQTLNQILVEMDGFDTDTNVIILAATNRPDILDPALTRPGRFDRRVVLDRPDVRGREAIFKVHVRGKPLANNVDLQSLAKATPGFVGADIENMINEAAILAGRQNKKVIENSDFQEAVERVILGPERRSRIMSEIEKRITAYHEAGHALVSHLLPFTDPVRKVTIMPRGISGGSTLFLPEEDLSYMTRSRLKNQIVVALGGRAAEEIVFDEITTGASGDLDRVTKLARNMVMRFGMSEKLGPMLYGQKDEMVFLGREIGEQRDYSEAVAEQIDSEVRDIVSWAYDEARSLLREHRDQLDRIAQRLLEVETLEREQFMELVGESIETDGPNTSPKIVHEDNSSRKSSSLGPNPSMA